MRMLRWICGKTRLDKIRTDNIKESVEITPIVDEFMFFY